MRNMNVEKQVEYWRKNAADDLDAASVLCMSEHVGPCLLFCYFALDKALKGLVCRAMGQTPPFKQNLRRLSEQAGVAFTAEQVAFLERASEFDREIRHDVPTAPVVSSSDLPNVFAQAKEMVGWAMRAPEMSRSAPTDSVRQAAPYATMPLSVSDPSITAIVSCFLSRLRSSGVCVDSAVLYGSQARGTAREDSDIDLLVLSPDFEELTWEQSSRVWQIAKEVDERIEPVLIGTRRYREDDWHPLIDAAKREGVEIKV